MTKSFDLEGVKSYATEKRLKAELVAQGFDTLAHVICYTKEGRATAVFVDRHANPVVFKGFKWIYGY